MSGTGLVEGKLPGDGGKEFGDIFGSLGRGFEEEKPGLFCVGFSVGGGNGALVGLFRDEIELVASEGDDDVFIGLTLEFLDPSLGLVEGSRLCNVIYDDGTVGVAVVHGGQGLVTLLAGGIPNFELDSGGLVEGDGLGEERSADGGFAERVELILDKSQDDGTLSDSGLSKENELKLSKAVV